MAKECATSDCEHPAFRDGDYCQNCELDLHVAAVQGFHQLEKWLRPHLAFADWRHDHGIED